MTIALTQSALHRAVHDLDVAAEQLHSDRAAADQRVSAYLDGGWSGTAADSFEAAWALWRSGAREVLEGLVATRELLAAVHHDLTTTDEHSDQQLRVVASRLIERLG